jgi:hypothetical protein
MNQTRRMTAVIDSKVRRLDPKTIVQGTMFDEPSGRVFVTLVRGSRRTEVSLLVRDLEENHSESVDRALEHAIKILPSLPIG